VQRAKVLVKRDTRLRVVTLDRLYDTIQAAHLACGHGGRDSTYAHIQHRYANVTKEQISAFVELCDQCRNKKLATGDTAGRRRNRKSQQQQPSSGNGDDDRGRGQVEFVDMRSKPDGEFRYVLAYRDRISRMVFLRAVRDSVPEEAAPLLADLFAEIGSPLRHHSTLGDEFVAAVVRHVRQLWPDCRMVRGRAAACLPDAGELRREQREIRGRLLCWMRDHRSQRWAGRALRQVQYARNAAVHLRTGRAPFQTVFGTVPLLGLDAGSVPADRLDALDTEEQLDALVPAPSAPAETENAAGEEEVPAAKSVVRRPSCTVCGGSLAVQHKCETSRFRSVRGSGNGCRSAVRAVSPAPSDPVRRPNWRRQTPDDLLGRCFRRCRTQTDQPRLQSGAGTAVPASPPPSPSKSSATADPATAAGPTTATEPASAVRARPAVRAVRCRSGAIPAGSA
jgi:hypothetical protein